RRRVTRRRLCAELLRLGPSRTRSTARVSGGARSRDHRCWARGSVPAIDSRRRTVMNTVYAKYELLRLVRNKSTFIFSLIFPLMLFVLIAGTNKDQTIDVGGLVLKFPTYYMVSMAGYGAMIATISGGARIAAERAVGWNR